MTEIKLCEGCVKHAKWKFTVNKVEHFVCTEHVEAMNEDPLLMNSVKELRPFGQIIKDPDFTYEQSEYDIGIQGGWWLHDPCAKAIEGWSPEVTENYIAEHIEGFGMNRKLVAIMELTCMTCEKSTFYLDTQEEPDVEEFQEDTPDLYDTHPAAEHMLGGYGS